MSHKMEKKVIIRSKITKRESTVKCDVAEFAKMWIQIKKIRIFSAIIIIFSQHQSSKAEKKRLCLTHKHSYPSCSETEKETSTRLSFSKLTEVQPY